MTSKTYTFADLKVWKKEGPCLAVIGNPITHSISPILHNSALKTLAKTFPRFKEWNYFAFHILPHELNEALGLFLKAGFWGLNVTLPYKRDVCSKSIVKLDPIATVMGSANTLVANGTYWNGTNTDGIGLDLALRESFDISFKNQNVVVIGIGGVGHSTVTQALLSRAKSVGIYHHNPEATIEFLKKMHPVANDQDVKLYAASLFNIPKDCLVINATSVGMSPSDKMPLDLRIIQKPAHVYDVIYASKKQSTELVRVATEMKIPAANGSSMLVHQAARALAIWTRQNIPIDSMRKALEEALKDRS